MGIFFAIFFALFVFPVFAEETTFFLSKEDGTKTTQFATSDKIYIEGSCPISASDEITKIYITNDETWSNGKSLYDVSSGIESFRKSSDGNIARMLIWKSPLKEGAYDLILDVNNNTTWQSYENCILGMSDTGFRVGNPTPPPPPPASPQTPPTISPPPAPAVTVTPPPPAPPSKTFSLDDRVEVKDLSNIRQSPGGSMIGQHENGARGIVVGGPTQASLGSIHYWFWNVNFDDNPDGWVAESTLFKIEKGLVSEKKPPPAPALELKPSEESVATTTSEMLTPNVEVATTQSPKENEEAKQKELAQVSEAGTSGKSNSFDGPFTIGLMIFLGLVVGAFIISRAIRRS
jgi:hypothetical protein